MQRTRFIRRMRRIQHLLLLLQSLTQEAHSALNESSRGGSGRCHLLLPRHDRLPLQLQLAEFRFETFAQ
jgi:hypothetical protein